MNYTKIRSILLIDDDQDDNFFFAKALEKLEIAVELETAGDGQEAFERLRYTIPDFILLDLNMPNMNGMTFLKRIKKIKELKDIPVIIYTTYLSIFDEIETKQLGAYSVFIKPAEFDKTVRTISEILSINFVRMSA